jgi:hypothetical protein
MNMAKILKVGTTQQIIATIVDKLCNQYSPGTNGLTATYVSSDPTIVTVSATGIVTAVAVGQTNVTVTFLNGGVPILQKNGSVLTNVIGYEVRDAGFDFIKLLSGGLGTDAPILPGQMVIVPANPTRMTVATALIGQPVQTVGSGLSDMTSSGTYTAVVDHVYSFVITTAAGTDKFKWSKDGGSQSAEIAITGGSQLIENGLSIGFNALTGHTLGNTWTITITAGQVVKATPGTFVNLIINAVGTGAQVLVYDGSGTSGILLYSSAALAVGLLSFNLKCATGLYVVIYASGSAPDLIVGWM